jgi:CDGSH-type Zn-finger protein
MASAPGTWPDPDAIPPAKHRPLYPVTQCQKFTCNKDGSRCECRDPLHDRVWHRFPHRVDLSNGMKKWICMCGQSKVYPLCDGWGHEAYNEAYGTNIQPVVVGSTIMLAPLNRIHCCNNRYRVTLWAKM